MRPFVHDQYSPLQYKAAALGDGVRRPGVASWVPDEHARRLAAYQFLAALCDNVARYYLPDSQWAITRDEALAGFRPPAEKYREYGDADRIVIAARSALLGDEQSLQAPGAVEDLELDQGQQPPPEAVRAQEALDYLRTWAGLEKFWLEMAEVENDAVKLGDGVWTLFWDAAKKRPRLQTFDPGFYFPPEDPRGDKDFPSRVHIAWEQEGLGLAGPELHRLTWDLGQIRPRLDPDAPTGELRYLFDEQGRPVPQPGDRLDPEGRLVRDLPWNTEPTAVTCHFTHAIYQLSKIKGQLFDLDGQNARYDVDAEGRVLRELDLRLDFLPVVHEPNTPARREGFGRSVLTLVAQIIDDLSLTHTDLAESAALVGSSTLVTKGGPAGDIPGGPGVHLNLPVGASAEYLDVSKNLDALLKRKADLKDDLSENSRISKATLGRIDGSNSVSGLALALSFSPTEGLVRDLRAVRDEKYPLLLKMVLRMAQANGLMSSGPTPAVKVAFGSFQPADKAQAVQVVTSALKANAMSTLTAVLYLQQQGFPIEDAAAEVERIQRENVAAAVAIVDATGDVNLALEHLGLKAEQTPPAP